MDTGINSRSSKTPLTTVSGKRTVNNMLFYRWTGGDGEMISNGATGSPRNEPLSLIFSPGPKPTYTDRMINSGIPLMRDIGKFINLITK